MDSSWILLRLLQHGCNVLGLKLSHIGLHSHTTIVIFFFDIFNGIILIGIYVRIFFL